MPHAIIRGKNGRRHEVDFGDAPIRVEIYASDETVEFLLRQILKPTRRNADASRSSTFHGTCSVRLLVRLPGARRRAASKTAWIGDGRLGSSTQQISDGAAEMPRLLPRLFYTALVKSTWTGPNRTLPQPYCCSISQGATKSLPKRMGIG